LLPTLGTWPGRASGLPAECEPVYTVLGVAPQQPLGRWSALLIEARVRKVMDR